MLLQELLRQRPNDRGLRRRLADELHRLERYDDAERLYQSLLREIEGSPRRDSGQPTMLRTHVIGGQQAFCLFLENLRLAEMLADQIGGPTPAGDIARTCLQVLDLLRKNREKSGVYHYAGAPDASWADFAREIFAASGQKVTVEDIPSSAYPTPAARPSNSRLDCSTLETEFAITRPDWKAAVRKIVGQLI